MGRNAELKYLVATARALAGGTIFAFPLLMTMEMWWLGFHMDPFRLALFLIVSLPLLTGLSFLSGFEDTFRWRDDVMDALTAYGIGFVASAALLMLFGVIGPNQPWTEIVGKIAVQSVPAAIGGMLARKQLGEECDQESNLRRAGYPGILFVMAMGALFLAFNVAPTEEMLLISFRMSPWQALGLALLSLLVLHAFVYAIGFSGQAEPVRAPLWHTVLRFAVPGYGIALLVSLYVLWTFGRTDGMALMETVQAMVVLGFPAALGAATARLVI
ncbi:TIGR02587 family membrane protein [Arenibaculum pallidiluteum]|uniref:TIGR02587 family membrane protein n=1 Tax=Arenibaculum pallidiluteum TaxID=2812559 RepID=UPI001F21BE78|nr:TIGR02587 family membrane protein [Arenibaculum pallidiluteum]